MKKYVAGLIIVALLAAGWFWGRGRLFTPAKTSPRYRFAEIETRDMINQVSATGALSAVITVVVGSEVSGQIKELLVDFNSPVKAGQMIARIDPKSYETLVRQAEAELNMAKAKLFSQQTEIGRYQADLENARANWLAAGAQIKKAEASLENARRHLKRQKALVDQDYISRNDHDTAQTTFEEASALMDQALAQEAAAKSKIASGRASLAIARALIKEAEAQVELKIAALDKRKVDLENTIIRSPVDGVVIDRSVDVGQTVAASLQAPTLFTIAQDLRKMQVSTSVDEADIGRIKEGQSARFTVDAFGTRKFFGKVSQIRKMGKTVQNVVTYEVIISADNRDLSLMPGMTADVAIELLKKPRVLSVVSRALRFTPPEVKPNGTGGTRGPAENASPGEAGDGRPAGRRPDPEARIQRYTERLNLSESQQDELRQIFRKMGQIMLEARQNPSPGPGGGLKAVREKIRKASQSAIMRILDTEQRELFRQMAAENRPRQGTLWQLDASGRPAAIRVTLGASDTTHTEIIGPAVRAGMQVIAGIE